MILRFQTVTFLLAVISSANGLQASDIQSDTPVSSLLSSAKTHLANGSPQDALLYFNAAITKDPSNYLTIFQRGATYLSLGRLSRAAEDFDQVLKLKPGFEGALAQRGKIRLRSGNWTGAKEDLEATGKLGEAELAQLQEAQAAAGVAQEAEKKEDWETCVSQSSIAIMKAMGSPELRRLRAKCHLERGDIEEGINDLTRLSQLSPNTVQPHLQISAMLFYSLADMERGMNQIRKCLHSDPDSKVCSGLFRGEKRNLKQIKNLNKYLESRKFHKAAELLVGTKGETGLLEDIQQDVKSAQEDGYIHPKAPNALYADLVEKTCAAYRAMNSKRKARPYCTQCLEFNPSSLHGLLSKAEDHIDAEQYEAALQTLNTASEHHPQSQEIHTLQQKAQTLLKRSKQKDYYKVLGVDREADEATIKRAYRKLTKQFHPDKAHSQGIPKEEAEKKMASINEAYEVLSDAELRNRFDHGDDPNDPQSGQQPFNPFGPGAGGSPFFYQQGGGGNSHFKFAQGGFDFQGGFPF
ncbi:DnaJ domain-containing protein [Arthroderma uncinatum]|uniref:DnaJ domain-containing protein n=1 Tax=Arthroderma uncinatum TaxID=74035 RepID=UPI00144A588B|nr:DnaJ domain-containing protein [Arthroderma uncinatum]KAF3480005.1 DnaJ domain-containing protein [Arthroderma uncinatum]